MIDPMCPNELCNSINTDAGWDQYYRVSTVDGLMVAFVLKASELKSPPSHIIATWQNNYWLQFTLTRLQQNKLEQLVSITKHIKFGKNIFKAITHFCLVNTQFCVPDSTIYFLLAVEKRNKILIIFEFYWKHLSYSRINQHLDR